ncbi:MAG: histone deacetylase family protein, partial [Actinomycetota bacterium]|nr:histone deacetylase family protein [Actinomycetota bacterium]
MRLLCETHPGFVAHDAGAGHPECPDRLAAALAGIESLGLGDDLVKVEPPVATNDELAVVHDPAFVEALERFCAGGGGQIDGAPRVGRDSWNAALLAVG